MKSFKEYLEEVYSFDKNNQTSSEKNHHYHFSDGDTHYRVQISHDSPIKNRADVSFSTIDEKGHKVFSKTNTGGNNTRKIFNTVHNIMKSHGKDHGIDEYSFSASGSEPSRQKLYDRLAKSHGGGLVDIGRNDSHHYIAKV